MVTQYKDAQSVMGDTLVDPAAIDDLARGARTEYNRGVNEKMARDYVTMYHPDGTTSLVQLPPLSRNGKNVADRQRKLMHYVLNKKNLVKQPNGDVKWVQWWYPSPPPGWKAQQARWRCPVQECTRAGGLKDLLNLWRHIKNKHPGEVEMYGDVLNAIKDRLAKETAVDLDTLLMGGADDGETPAVSLEDIEAAKLEAAQLPDAQTILEQMEPAVPADTFTTTDTAKMCDCGWVDKTGKGMAIHKARYCILKVKQEV